MKSNSIYQTNHENKKVSLEEFHHTVFDNFHYWLTDILFCENRLVTLKNHLYYYYSNPPSCSLTICGLLFLLCMSSLIFLSPSKVIFWSGIWFAWIIVVFWLNQNVYQKSRHGHFYAEKNKKNYRNCKLGKNDFYM